MPKIVRKKREHVENMWRFTKKLIKIGLKNIEDWSITTPKSWKLRKNGLKTFKKSKLWKNHGNWWKISSMG